MPLGVIIMGLASGHLWGEPVGWLVFGLMWFIGSAIDFAVKPPKP